MSISEQTFATLDKYFGDRVTDWYRDGRRDGVRVPSKSKAIRSVKSWDELALWINVLDGRELL